MKPRIMYIELKTHEGGHNDNGPAWISRVSFTKSGKGIRWRGKLLVRWNAGCGNYIDDETDEVYWVSGPKKNGQDRYPWGAAKVQIDEDAREEYWKEIREMPGAVERETTN